VEIEIEDWSSLHVALEERLRLRCCRRRELVLQPHLRPRHDGAATADLQKVVRGAADCATAKGAQPL
jgi:hypothetical protein